MNPVIVFYRFMYAPVSQDAYALIDGSDDNRTVGYVCFTSRGWEIQDLTITLTDTEQKQIMRFVQGG